MFDILDQDKVWLTAERVPVGLEEMDPDHRRNTLNMLLRNPGYRMRMYHRKQMMMLDSFDPDEMELRELSGDPEKWIRNTPLVKRLQKLVDEDERQFVTVVDGEVIPQRQELV